ncbi:AAA family ATPase [Sorangium sp. So ce131]|uniref:AAA family ATPase n=1 Tax=Sorangium sp. So ce131 TaxID=3133282 RepID=UPI003F5E3D85
MKITFSNLGTIKRTTLDLAPLTVIIGPNNSGKTYVAYATYGLFPHDADSWTIRGALPTRSLRADPLRIPIDKRFNDTIARTVDARAQRLREGLDTFFQDSSGKLFSTTTLALNIEPTEIRAAVKHAVERWEDPSSISLEDDVVQIVDTHRGGMTAYPNWYNFVDAVLRELLPNPLLLPAERNAFIITYKMLANRRYKLLKDAQREIFAKRSVTRRQIDLLREQGEVRYPRPVEDFLDFLTDVELSARPPARGKGPFQALADEIEQKIQRGNKTRFKQTRLGGQEIKVDVKRGLSIDLYNASSSIKQLAPLLLYLRFRAAPNDFLIIDEPEMGLHPESQARLLEALAILVSLGVRVLVTTHSPYIMAHLNNLAHGDVEHPRRLKAQAPELYLGDERAFLPMAKISAYEMRDGELRSLKDPDYGVRWDTLSDVSVDLQQKFFAIDEKGSREKRNRGRGEEE